MSEMGLFVDCGVDTAGQSVRALTDQELADFQAGQIEAATVAAAQAAITADRVDARRQLRAKAKTDTNLALIARAMDLGPSAPDPGTPPAG
jgi:hypothetical protein